MSFNFFKNFAKVKAESLEEGMINLATSLDKEGVAETVIRQKIDEHDERIKMYQSAVDDYKREQAEADREESLYNRYMSEAETIQGILNKLEKAKSDIVADPSNQPAADIISNYNESELTTDLMKLLDVIEKRAPILEKEKAEALEAKQWMDELKDAVDEISTELLTLRKTVDEAKRDIAKAEIDAERNRKRAEQAAVIAGLRKSGNKFDTAINALKNKATEKQSEADTYKIKAETLKKPVDTTDTIVGKYTTTVIPTTSVETLSDRLARLKTKA